MIDTREELVNALSEAAELEHGLLVQYLFAAFSLKRRTDEGISPVQQSLIVDWEQTILRVAHQEMYHLGTVCNLLSAIGAAPQFGRPHFPQPNKSYYPFDFTLERFNDQSLYRFIVFELPKDEKPPSPPTAIEKDLTLDLLFAAPDPLIYSYIGELYGQIRSGFQNVPEKELFIGPEGLQDSEDWGLRMRLHHVKDRKTAEAAIEQIVLEGEGSPSNREGSHYNSFLLLREQLNKEKEKDQHFDPSRPVVKNPQTRDHREARGAVNLIKHGVTLEVAELFNDIYTSMLLMLIQYYSYGGETEIQRKMLRDSSRRLMSAVVRPMAEILSEMPVEENGDGRTAGPGFEIYSGLRLAPDRGNRWIVLRERLEKEILDLKGLLVYEKHYPVLSRLNRTTEAMQGTLVNLAKVFAG